MALNEAQRKSIADFRAWLESGLKGDARLGPAIREDRADESTLSLRWPSAQNPRVWFDVTLRPFLPQVRVGIVTDDRWKNEDFEEKIEESGDTMPEFVGLGFEEAGLPWTEPPVEHYRDQGKYFTFATPVELKTLDDLSVDSMRIKTRQMLDGYHVAFGRFLPA